MTHTKNGRPAHHWRRDLVELAALFTAVAVADGIANLIGHGPGGPELLMASAAALLATAGFHTWWARRHGHPPPVGDTGALPPARAGQVRAGGSSAAPAGTAGGGTAGDALTAEGARPSVPEASSGSRDDGSAESDVTTLWRMRTTVRDEPGSLAALCVALAGLRVDILSLGTHPLTEGTVDEFLLRSPLSLSATALSRAVARAGGSGIWIERADAHDLVDAPTRVLNLATRTALDAAELPLALRALLGRCSIRSLPAPGTPQVKDSGLDGTVLRLPGPDGGSIVVERPYLPFTPTEFARARALVELDTRLGPRTPRGAQVLALSRGTTVTVRRSDSGDLAAAKEMHERCSPGTLRMRYHGPVRDADRYLDHLLSPRFGRTLAAQTASGRIVALGHLLWDGDETEVALLVEDAWQRRGIGSELLGRLVALAVEAGCENVYAVTQASNTGMVAAMRGLGLPLDYQIEEGTLVVTARLDATPVRSRLPYDQPHDQGERLAQD